MTIHGHRRAYVKAGHGPRCSCSTDLAATKDLAAGAAPARPALHRDRARPPRARGLGQAARGLQLGGYANGMRDLLTVLDIDQGDGGRVTASAAGWRCNSPISSPSARSGCCWSAPGAWVPRSRPPSGDHDHGLLPGDGRAHHARRTPRRHAPASRVCRARGSRSSATSTRSPRSTVLPRSGRAGRRSGTSYAPSSTGRARS